MLVAYISVLILAAIEFSCLYFLGIDEEAEAEAEAEEHPEKYVC